MFKGFHKHKSAILGGRLGPILKNIGWLSSFRVFELLVSLTIGIWLVRYLGPTEFGLFSYVLAIGALISPFIGLGVANILSREILLYPKEKYALLGTAFWINLISGFFGFILLLGLAFLLKPTDYESLFLVFVYSFSFLVQSFGVVGNWFDAKLQSKINVKAGAKSIIISNIIKLLLIIFGFPVLYFILVSLLETVTRIIFLCYSYLRVGEELFSWKFDSKWAIKMIKSSWPLIFSGLMVAIYMKIDQVMIGVILNDYQLGLYSIAVKLTEVFYFLPGVIMVSLFPSLISSKKRGIKVYKNRLKMLFSFMTYVPFLIIIPVFLLSNYFVSILYGVDFMGAVPALSISIWALFGVFVKTAVDNYLICENKTKIIFFGSMIGAISNILLNLILIPIYGISGAALATMISYILAAYLGLIFFKETRSVFFLLIKSFDPRILYSTVLRIFNNELKK